MSVVLIRLYAVGWTLNAFEINPLQDLLGMNTHAKLNLIGMVWYATLSFTQCHVLSLGITCYQH